MGDTNSSSRIEIWKHRVAAWWASGERAEDFSRGQGYAASTLRWWASKLKREAPAAPAAPAVQLARVIRADTPSPPLCSAPADATIVIEAGPTGPRVSVGAGADRATLAMVLDVLGVEVRGAR